MTKEQKAVIANLKKEDVWPFHKAGTRSKNLLFIFSRNYIDSFGGTKKFKKEVLDIKNKLKEIEVSKKKIDLASKTIKELDKLTTTLNKELETMDDNIATLLGDYEKLQDKYEKLNKQKVDNKKGDIMTKGFNWNSELKVLGYLVITGIITTGIAWIAGLDLAGQPAWIVGIFMIVNLTLKGIKDKYLPKS